MQWRNEDRQHHRIIELLLFLMNIHPIVTTEADDDKNLLKSFFILSHSHVRSIYTYIYYNDEAVKHDMNE